MKDRLATNPKDLAASGKVKLHLVPPIALVLEAIAFERGAAKYGGGYNWRAKSPSATVYLDAALRHLLALIEGEDFDPESGLPHEAHVRASMAILLDARAAGTLIDDRPCIAGGHGEALAAMRSGFRSWRKP